MIYFGVVGLILITIAIWLKEKAQNVLFIFGGLGLLVYSASIENLIFIILQIVFIVSAGVELFKKR